MRARPNHDVRVLHHERAVVPIPDDAIFPADAAGDRVHLEVRLDEMPAPLEARAARRAVEEARSRGPRLAVPVHRAGLVTGAGPVAVAVAVAAADGAVFRRGRQIDADLRFVDVLPILDAEPERSARQIVVF